MDRVPGPFGLGRTTEQPFGVEGTTLRLQVTRDGSESSLTLTNEQFSLPFSSSFYLSFSSSFGFSFGSPLMPPLVYRLLLPFFYSF